MGWRRHFDHERVPRPKTRKLTEDERNRVVAEITAAVNSSPILTAFSVRVVTLRNRFYLEWRWQPEDNPTEWTTYGRITPLADPTRPFLLEFQYGQDRWSEVASGSPKKLMQAVAGDKEGTFHGLGSLDRSLRRASGAGSAKLAVKLVPPTKFVFEATDKKCSVQEALYFFFGLPVHVIAQPAGWYSCHRTPRIVEFSEDKTRVLVYFMATSWSGESFGGTCLYLKRDGRWAAYTIRPNQAPTSPRQKPG